MFVFMFKSPSSARPAAKKKQDAAVTSMAAFDGRKQWLTRKEIDADYGWSYKTTERLEKDGKLIPSVIHGGTKRYFRPHIEALLRNSFVSLRALRTESEVE
jgi:hypothetical protein